VGPPNVIEKIKMRKIWGFPNVIKKIQNEEI
jgi:hypothetical protein